MLAEILHDSFARANQRAGLILLDSIWKLAWTVLALTFVFVAALWFTSGLQSVEWDDTGIPALNGWIAAVLLQEFWNSNRTELLITTFMIVGFSAVVWVLLEAVFRRKIVRDVCGGVASRKELRQTLTATYPFKLFLASSVMKNAILWTTAALAVVVWWRGAATVGIVTFFAVIFLLTLIDTLIRADAVDLLGTDLIRVGGLLGILMSLECLVAASVVTVLGAGFLNVAGQAEFLAVLAAAAAAAVFLNLLHSYLLLVRYSAIAIMRQDVVEI